jgi:membrane protease YdiL (CAAX protease family)
MNDSNIVHNQLSNPLRYSLIGFCALTFAFTWACWLSIGLARAGWLQLPISQERLATLGQFGPLIAAVVFSLRDGHAGGLRGLIGRCLHWRVHPLWFAIVLLLLPACLVSAICLHDGLQGKPFALPSLGDPATLFPHLMLTLLFGGPLGEEPGWRGFVLPRLRAAWHPIPASLLLGAIWALWHLPLWWIADVPAPFWLYVVGVLPLTYLFTWVSEHTGGSVLLALLFHASLNTSLARLPVQPAWVEWTTMLWLVALTVAIFECRRSRRVYERSEIHQE